ELVARHRDAVWPFWGEHGRFAEALYRLHEAGHPLFRHLAEQPALRTVRLPNGVTPSATTEVEWEDGVAGDGVARGGGGGSSLTYELSDRRCVAGVRIRCAHSSRYQALFQAFWRKGGEADFPEAPQFSIAADPLGPLGGAPGQEHEPLVIYIADTIDRIRLHPDQGPFTFEISEI